MKQVNYYCDNCGKEVHDQACARVTVFVHQGYSDPSSKLRGIFSDRNIGDWLAAYWKHKELYSHLLCADCLGGYGENVNFNHGDDPTFGLKDKAKGWLEKIGVIKPRTINHP